MDTFCNNLTFSGVRKYHNEKRQNMHLRHKVSNMWTWLVEHKGLRFFYSAKLEISWVQVIEQFIVHAFFFFLFCHLNYSCLHVKLLSSSRVANQLSICNLCSTFSWPFGILDGAPPYSRIPFCTYCKTWTLFVSSSRTDQETCFSAFSDYGLCCNKNSVSGLCSGTGYWV